MNAKQTAIQISSDLDLLISVEKDDTGLITSGLVIGDTLYQNQYIILSAQKGELKENPTLGVGIADITNDEEILFWKKNIREELAKDGMRVDTLTIDTSTGEMVLIANYE